MPDDTTICNLALAKIGSAHITSLSESSQPARACKLFFEQTRDEVLSAHPWVFSTRRATLSRLSETPEFGWSYQYQLPSDCLAVTQLNGWQPLESRDLFEIEGDRLLTDVGEAQIRYSARVTDSSKFSSTFVEALSVKLAAKLSYPLTGKTSEFTVEYERITAPLAAISNARQGRPKRKLPHVESDLVRSRFGA